MPVFNADDVVDVGHSAGAGAGGHRVGVKRTRGNRVRATCGDAELREFPGLQGRGLTKASYGACGARERDRCPGASLGWSACP